MSLKYVLATVYAGESLLSGFNWFNGSDPTSGFVRYQTREDADQLGLYSINNQTGSVRLGVDHSNQYGLDSGRPSIRLESIAVFNQGLFIGDFNHMPSSTCGLWPAFWAYGPQWPENGEVDIIEGVNMANRNLMSAHTSAGCTLFSNTTVDYTGVLETTNCGDSEQTDVGCGYASPVSDSSSYGDAFNAIGGGVYAMEWTSSAIRVWHFARPDVPSDITNEVPDPSTWGPPEAVFGGSHCNPDSFFHNMNLVINIDFCGSYGNYDWGVNGCSTLGSSCNQFVGQNPEAFVDAYWDVASIKAYSLGTLNATLVGIEAPSLNSTATWMPLTSSSTIVQPTTTILTTTFSTITVTVRDGSIIPPTVHLSVTTVQLSRVSSTSVAVTEPTSSSRDTHGLISTAISSASTSSSSFLPSNLLASGNYTFLGCFESVEGFPTFTSAGPPSNNMTPELCVQLCNPAQYAAVFDRNCFCAPVLSPDARTVGTAVTDGKCNIPCPGDPHYFCGGLQPPGNIVLNDTLAANGTFATLKARATFPLSNVLLSLYGNLGPLPEPAPAMGGAPPPVTVTVVSTVIYTAVCATNPASLASATYVATLTAIEPACPYPPGSCGGPVSTPCVSMTTIVQSCSGCGPDGCNIITLTVPVAVVSVQTVVPIPAAPAATAASSPATATAAATATASATATATDSVVANVHATAPAVVPPIAKAGARPLLHAEPPWLGFGLAFIVLALLI